MYKVKPWRGQTSIREAIGSSARRVPIGAKGAGIWPLVTCSDLKMLGFLRLRQGIFPRLSKLRIRGLGFESLRAHHRINRLHASRQAPALRQTNERGTTHRESMSIEEATASEIWRLPPLWKC